MNYKMLELNLSDLPEIIHNIPSPPKRLYYRGDNLLEILKLPRVAIVGSRKITAYGRQVTQELSEHLAQQGVVIVSGLAYGVDAVAHEAAVKSRRPLHSRTPGTIRQHLANSKPRPC